MNASIEELTGWLKQQRWFGGKGVPISKVEVLERIPMQSAPDAEASIVRVSYVIGTAETYLVLLQRMADGQLRDALEDPGVARAVLDFARDARRVPVGQNTVRAESIGRGAEVLASLSREPSVRSLGVEQSNTSVVVGDRVLLKVLRKLEVGLSPEVEMGGEHSIGVGDERKEGRDLSERDLGSVEMDVDRAVADPLAVPDIPREIERNRSVHDGGAVAETDAQILDPHFLVFVSRPPLDGLDGMPLIE